MDVLRLISWQKGNKKATRMSGVNSKMVDHVLIIRKNSL